MADINSEIKVNIDTSSALSNIKALQTQISAFHTQLTRGGAAANAASAQMTQNLINTVNATGKFNASIKTVKTTTESFTNALEKNKLSFGEYFRYAGASSKSFGKNFKQEFETINKVARERVKDLQTQYIQLGRDANGAMRSIAVRPLTLDMDNLATKTAIAAQRQQLLNQLLKQGSTNLLNFGKNTQWAGRQLMVGFTIPLGILGSTAAKTFMQMEEQAIKFKRVYGDSFTSTEETDRMLNQIKELASEFTKYGVAIADTMEIAASAAATGKTGADLTAQVAEATRLAVLGGVEQSQALETTISLTNAFGTAADQLRGKINFLNAVENQTVTSIEDLTIAIPKAGPVVEQLGGEVEDLAYFLTAMREGGINASEGANALKSGLAAMINPTGKAKDMLLGLGVNLQKIVETNKGDVKGTVLEFAKALDTLDPLDRSKAIEQLFGKFQFARISTLFKNVIAEGSQANRVLELTNASSTELAMLANKELGRIEASPMFKFQKAVADFQAQLAPVGEQFLKAVTPIIEFGTKVLESFNNLGDGVKGAIVNITGIVAGIGPVLLMTFGLIANGVANVIKGFAFIKNVFNRASTASTVLGETTNYMTQEQLEAAAVAASLEQTHNRLTQAFTSEKGAIDGLTAAYRRAVAAQQAFNGPITPGGPLPKPKGFANGGMIMGPGSGTSDSIPAMVSNGEFIVNAKRTKQYLPLLQAIASGKVPGFRSKDGGSLVGPKSVSTDLGYSQGHFSGYREATGRQILELGENDSQIAKITKRLESQRALLSRMTGNVVTFEDILDHTFQVYDNAVVGQSLKLNSILGQSGKGGSATGAEVKNEYANLRGQAHGMPAYLMEQAGVSEGNIKATLTDLSDEVNAGIDGFITKTGKAAEDVKISGDDLDEIMRQAYENVSSRNKQLATAYKQMGKISGIASVEKTSSGSNTRLGTTSDFYKSQSMRDKVIESGLKYSDNPEKPYLSRISKRVFSGANLSLARQVKEKNPEGYRDIVQESDSKKRLEMLKVEAKKLGIRVVEVTTDGVTDGFDAATKRNSPPQEAINAGEDYGNAINSGAKSKTDDATQAGKDLAQAQINGASSVPTRRSGRRVTTPGTVDPTIVMPTTQSGKRRRVTTPGDVVPTGDGRYDVVPANTAPDARTVRSKKDVQKAVKARMGGAKYRAAQAKRMATPGRASGAGFVASGALAMGAGMVGGPVGDAMGAASGVLSVVSMFGGTLAKIIPVLVRFAGPIGIAIGVVTTLVGVIELATRAERERVQQVKDMAGAFTNTADKAKVLGDFFGKTNLSASKYFVASATSGMGAQDASASESLRKNEDFLKQYKTTIASLKNGTKEQRQLIMDNLSIQLSPDFAPDEMAIIIDALKKEAGVTSVDLKFNALDFSSKETAAESLKSIQSTLQTTAAQGISGVQGTTTNITSGMYGTGEVVGTTPRAYSEEEKAKIAQYAGAVQSSMIAVRSAFDQGKISGEQYRVALNNVFTEMESLGPEKAKLAIDALADSMFSLDQAKVVKGIKDKTVQMNLLAIAATDVADAATLAAQALALQGVDDAAGRKALAAIKAKIAKKAADITKPKTTGGGGGTGGAEGGMTGGEQKKVSKYEAGLKLIDRQEKAINEKYDKRIKALDEVARLNANISQQQRDQLDLVDALSRGDIAAAARAAQTLRTNEAQANIENEKAAMERARTSEIANIKDPLGRTKETLTALIDAIQASADRRDFNRLNRAGGGMIPKYFANGGTPLGSDIVPAMLTPGEFVVKKSAVSNFGAGNLKGINEGTYSGESVYNYSINVNVSSNASPDAIARTVMAQIKNVDSQRLRGNRI